MSLRISYKETSPSLQAQWEVGETKRLFAELDRSRDELTDLLSRLDDSSISEDTHRYYELLLHIQNLCLTLAVQEMQLAVLEPCELDEHTRSLVNAQKRLLVQQRGALSASLMGVSKLILQYESYR